MDKQLHIIRTATRATSIILIALSLVVAIPLSIMTYQDNGGPWGFGIIGLPILIPLSFYILFGFVGLIRREDYQRKWFVITLGITFLIGMVMLVILPVYPVAIVLVPLVLSAFGMLSHARFKYYLIFMLVLGIAANIMLLKWEVDFNRNLPIIQLFSADRYSE